MRRVLILLAVLCIAALPSGALAQENGDDRGGFALRISGDYTHPAGDSLNALVVINGDATIDGTVEDFILVINGDARVSSAVEGDITVIRGTLTLESTAVVNDVTLVRSELVEQPGATIRGDVTRTTRWIFGSTGAIILFGIAFWVAMIFAVLVSGVVFAAIAGRQLTEATTLMGERVGQSILAGVIALIGLPIVAVLAVVTIIGIPLGIGILLFLLPALMFLGYIVAGTWLGFLMLNRTPIGDRGTHPYAQAIVGLLVLQLLVLIPGLAPIIFIFGGVWGGGGLVYMAFRNMRGPRREEPAEAPPPAPQPAP